MPSKKKQPQIPLPKSWDKYVKSGILRVFALAQNALIHTPQMGGRQQQPARGTESRAKPLGAGSGPASRSDANQGCSDGTARAPAET